MIIDTHIHLDDEKYEGIQDEVILSSFQNNVSKIIAMGTNKASSIKAVELATKYPFVYAAIGIHPMEVNSDIDVNWIYGLANNLKVVAIGEIGLDYYWDKSNIELQKEIFIKQLRIANDLNLPICVHSREANNDCLQLLKENNARGVIHCFSGSVQMAEEFTKLGFYLGIGGVLTFKNSKTIKEVVKDIDLKYLLTETDGPYLTPEPFRGKLNRSEYIKYVIDAMANIKNISKGEVEESIEENVKRLFNI